MAATKTNERPGTRAVVRYVRVSAFKAREVLNLIRGESYGRASEILAFSERSVSEVVAKCLDSAVSNAENNDGIPAEELFVSACYADEGPTLKRWRPRARGRATPILKRTCHITIIMGRYTSEEIATQQARDEQRGRSGPSQQAAEARRQRVEKSRAAAESRAQDEEELEEAVDAEEVEAVEEAVDAEEVEAAEEAVDAEEVEAVEEAVEAVEEAVDAEEVEETEENEVESSVTEEEESN